MGITTITAARILEGQMRLKTGEENELSWEKFPWSAQSKTYNVNSQSADSGACATAYLCGVKTNQGKCMSATRFLIHGPLSSYSTHVAAVWPQAEASLGNGNRSVFSRGCGLLDRLLQPACGFG